MTLRKRERILETVRETVLCGEAAFVRGCGPVVREKTV